MSAKDEGVEFNVLKAAAGENSWSKPSMKEMSPEARKAVRAFALAILHGDDEHRAWLLEAAEAFIAGHPLPAPRGKGTQPEVRLNAQTT